MLHIDVTIGLETDEELREGALQVLRAIRPEWPLTSIGQGTQNQPGGLLEPTRGIERTTRGIAGANQGDRWNQAGDSRNQPGG